MLFFKLLKDFNWIILLLMIRLLVSLQLLVRRWKNVVIIFLMKQLSLNKKIIIYSLKIFYIIFLSSFNVYLLYLIFLYLYYRVFILSSILFLLFFIIQNQNISSLQYLIFVRKILPFELVYYIVSIHSYTSNS